jgi:hypothetical protein
MKNCEYQITNSYIIPANNCEFIFFSKNNHYCLKIYLIIEELLLVTRNTYQDKFHILQMRDDAFC